MTSSVHPPDPVSSRRVPRLLWSLTTTGCPRGLALARERGWLLAWDENSWLHLVNAVGQRQAHTPGPSTLTAACAADTGSAYAAVGSRGEVWWLAPDLMPRWERTLPFPAVAVAIDPFGQYLAVSDAGGWLYLFSARGRELWMVRNPRPLCHLAFIPEEPFLVGCGDLGLVVCFDSKGECSWRDGLLANVGSLAVSGDGQRIVLACYSEGLRSYALATGKSDRLPAPEPCRLAALSYPGDLALVADLRNRLLVLDREGRTLYSTTLDHPIAALALGPLAEQAYVALPDRRVLSLDLGDVPHR